MARTRLLVLVAAFIVAVVIVIASISGSVGEAARTSASPGPSQRAQHPRHRSQRGTTAKALLPFASPSGMGLAAGPNLAPGSSPAVLPGDVLIADRSNSRLVIVDPSGKIVWQFPQPGDLQPGQTFQIPDDAFFSPDGRYILATQEDYQVISLIDIRTHRIVWQYGQPGQPGSGPNQLFNPDDAMLAPNGSVILADIKNCSILVLHTFSQVPIKRVGIQDNYCLHDPPLRWGSPNGAFPMADGNWLITEINGDWVDKMTSGGKVLWSTNPPGVLYPSDTNQVRPGVYITADYSNPGQVVEFDKQGRLLWRYGPASGPGALNTPSLCLPIPGNPHGDIICNDDSNDRVVVIDPTTNSIVWQYGHTGVAGSAPGYLSQPDGIDLAPPYSLLVRNASTMGNPAAPCDPALPQGACTNLAG